MVIYVKDYRTAIEKMELKSISAFKREERRKIILNCLFTLEAFLCFLASFNIVLTVCVILWFVLVIVCVNEHFKPAPFEIIYCFPLE